MDIEEGGGGGKEKKIAGGQIYKKIKNIKKILL